MKTLLFVFLFLSSKELQCKLRLNKTENLFCLGKNLVHVVLKFWHAQILFYNRQHHIIPHILPIICAFNKLSHFYHSFSAFMTIRSPVREMKTLSSHLVFKGFCDRFGWSLGIFSLSGILFVHGSVRSIWELGFIVQRRCGHKIKA